MDPKAAICASVIKNMVRGIAALTLAPAPLSRSSAAHAAAGRAQTFPLTYAIDQIPTADEHRDGYAERRRPLPVRQDVLRHRVVSGQPAGAGLRSDRREFPRRPVTRGRLPQDVCAEVRKAEPREGWRGNPLPWG